MTRHGAIQTLREIEGEHGAARFALPNTLQRALDDPTILGPSGLEVADFRRAVRHVEITYVIRLFAYFEGTSRELWATIRPTEPQMKKLLDGLAARCRMPADLLADAHDVREYRNEIVHGGEIAARLAMSECRSRLARFMSHFPPEW